MILSIFIDYRTTAAENIYITYRFDGGNPAESYMQPVDAETKMAQIEVANDVTRVDYTFTVRRLDGSERHEWRPDHHIDISSGITQLNIYDHWSDRPAHSEAYSSLLTHTVLRRHEPTTSAPAAAPSTLTISASAPNITPGLTLAISGSIPELGNWDPTKAVRMADANFPHWSAQIALPSTSQLIEYKFIAINTLTGETVAWEDGSNRSFIIPALPDNSAIAIGGLRPCLSLEPWRGSGTVIPVFSLRTAKSFGIGDFLDLIPLARWVKATGQHILQLLPVNDTTMTGRWTDSYPYNAISTFALHPVYLRVQELGSLPSRSDSAKLHARRRKLNALSEIDYEAVYDAKMEYARLAYKAHGEKTLATAEFYEFCHRNAAWLDNYVAFCMLRDTFATPDFTKWPRHETYSPELVNKVLQSNPVEANFHRYLQFHLDKQLKQASAFARSIGVGLKGDIPIGISRCSVDAWVSPELFNLNATAGAPPDDFAVNGQNWGFPTYNWQRMAQDGYAWWQARFTKMAEYFDAYRIDHLLGFFRIWEVPARQTYGLLGTFNPALPLTPGEMKERFGFEFSANIPVLTSQSPSQREIEATMPVGTEREHAMNAVANVLFIADTNTPNTYHPRIDAHRTEAFSHLSKPQQQAFRALYEDYFYHRHNEFWRQSALSKLPALIDSTGMLTCGEDLGMIPACVAPTMEDLSILSLEVQRMPKAFGVPYANPATYPYRSVATTSTHDMPGLRSWLIDNPEQFPQFARSMGIDPTLHPSSHEVCRVVIEQHVKSPSMLCVLPWQDWMSVNEELRRKNPADEVINIPAVSNHYWRYRMHIPIEQLLENQELTEQIKALASLR